MAHKAYIISIMGKDSYLTRCAHCGDLTTTQYTEIDDIPLEYQDVFCDGACTGLGREQQTNPVSQQYYKLCEHGDDGGSTNCVGAIKDLVIVNTENHKLEDHIQSRCLIGKL